MEPQPKAQPQNQQAISKDKVTDVFQRLRTSGGLTAVMDFSCCSACGMWDVDEVRSPIDTGYVFYNWQSALKVQDTGEVVLAFGDYPEVGAHPTQEIGQIVADAAERMGLPLVWNGRRDTRIVLVNLDKSDFAKHYEIILEYPPELFGGERTAVVRTENGRTFPYSFTDKEVKHKCGNGRFPCGGGPCLHLPAAMMGGATTPGD